MKRLLLALLVLIAAFAGATGQGKPGLRIQGTQFLLDGKPFQIHSGEMHYPRIPREYWHDRLQKARAMGLNTVCTYVFWNLHEAEPGKFSFVGNLDVASFISQAGDAGLKVILRPGPYVCSEWDFGGLPPWLLRDPAIRVRCLDPTYMKAVRRYIRRLGKELAGLQSTHGGPIILLQVENEYGSYGNDSAYLETLQALYRKAGFTIPFCTADGGARSLFEAGNVTGALPVVNFGSDPQREFGALEGFRSGIPLMCGEYWCGWFTHWGDERWGTSVLEANVRDLEWMLSTGKSFNLYMVHGGTNFGWWAGANWDGQYRPDITSYDYDAPLDEEGRPTEKYYAFRRLLAAHQEKGMALPEVPPSGDGLRIDSIKVTRTARLAENLPLPILSPGVRSMESYGQNYGFILYRTRLRGPRSGILTVHEVHDYGYVFVDGVFLGCLERRSGGDTITIPLTDSPAPVLDLLVEGMGRINFGSRLIDRKGITEWVTLRGVTLMSWEVYRLPMDEGFLQKLQFRASTSVTPPAFFQGSFDLQETGDTFLDMSRWKKGVVWVNGHHLGRYWSIGPQQRLYLPGPWLLRGRNEVLIFDPQARAGAPLRTFPTMRE